MSTFGEIVEPWSRTVWEDWDDANTMDISLLKWQNDINVGDNIDTLLLLEGKYLSESVKTQTESKMELVNSVPEVNLHLYKIKGTNEFVCVLKDYNLVQSTEIIELLKPHVTKSKNVIAILTKPLVEYQTSEISTQGCVIRSLSTSKPVLGILGNLKFRQLEQPNIISGVSAGVIWLRENLGLSALAIVFYVELAEEQEVHHLQMLLENLNIVTQKSKPIQILSSNLYI